MVLKSMNILYRVVFILLISMVCVSCDKCGRRMYVSVDPLVAQEERHDSVYAIKTVRLYIENSASMDGYINGGADFKNAILSYISDINYNDSVENISLNFINDRIIGMGNDITGFFKKLDSSYDFKKVGGRRGTTDIAGIVKTVLDSMDVNDISIIVSDFIFSPGKKDASRYLVEQQILIKDTFTQSLKQNPDLAVMFLRLKANFSGVYYNRKDDTTMLRDQMRPFYMLIVGQKSSLKVFNDMPEMMIKGCGIEEKIIIEKNIDIAACDNRPGSNRLSKDGMGGKFALNVSIPDSYLVDSSYLLDSLNYMVEGGKFHLVVKPQDDKKYSHLFEFVSTSCQNGELDVRLMKRLPEWVDEYDDDEGQDIYAALDKTYGLKTIVLGIFEAFTREKNYYMQLPKITITIK